MKVAFSLKTGLNESYFDSRQEMTRGILNCPSREDR
jgi:hypothetical protein